MTVTVTVLGCDGGYPGPGGAGSGYLVSADGANLCLDLGPGALARLQERIDLAELDAVVISHEHPDHSADLEGLAVALHFADPQRRVPVFAPASVPQHRYFTEWDELDWRIVADGGSAEVAGFKLLFSRTDHGPETLAVRVDRGRAALGYSGDTGPLWSARQLGADLDLLLCEATWTQAQEGRAQHLSGRQAGRTARDAGARRLVVTHRWPTIPEAPVVKEAAEAFGAPVEAARLGAALVVASTDEHPAPTA
ncbi:MAG: MBL fold metallo-hydrolase [Candidatus Dormiibacterota bacterium]